MSSLYATLQKPNRWISSMKETCLVNFNKFMTVFETKRRGRREKLNINMNYNLLCENNKKNEHKKGSSF